MSEMEEKLWSYIDGFCSPDERQAISLLIEHDDAYRAKYEELMLLNAELQSMEIDEPPMAFTYNVMEAIRTEQARQPLKAAVNNKIITLIAGFFIATLAVMVVYAIVSMKWSGGYSLTQLFNSVKVPAVKTYLTAPVINVFIFFDVMLALALLDGYLRKRNSTKQV